MHKHLHNLLYQADCYACHEDWKKKGGEINILLNHMKHPPKWLSYHCHP